MQLNILLPYTLLGVVFPGWSFPSFWILKTHGFYFPVSGHLGRWQASRKLHDRTATASRSPQRKPQSFKSSCHAQPRQKRMCTTDKAKEALTRHHMTLGPTSPPTRRPSWAAFRLLSSLNPEMSEASETSIASKSCSFQQENSLDANQTRSPAPEH